MRKVIELQDSTAFCESCECYLAGVWEACNCYPNKSVLTKEVIKDIRRFINEQLAIKGSSAASKGPSTDTKD